MQVDTKVIDILFRKISPNRIFQRLQVAGSVVDISADNNLFQQFAAIHLEEYSHDEQKLILSRLRSEAAIWAAKTYKRKQNGSRISGSDIVAENISLPSLALYDVFRLADKFLVETSQEPQCRIEYVNSWREVFLLLGQDIFVCAFLAQRDMQSQWDRRNFTWPAVIRTNHAGLNALLKKGIAENHQHLFGSSQTFSLSWCNLMNFPESHLDIDNDFDVLYQPFVTSGTENRFLTTKERVRYACLCRSHLFRWLHHEYCKQNKLCDFKGSDCKQTDIWYWINEYRPDFRSAREIRALRDIYAARIPQEDGSTVGIDYALEEHIYLEAPDAHYRSLAGERSLLYSCFRAFLEERMDERIKLVLYLYLVLKALFRSEMIQVNKQIGFSNFSNYQNRKHQLCARPCYRAEQIRMAINAPLQEGKVTTLETRVTPKQTAKDNYEHILEIDKIKEFQDMSVFKADLPKVKLWEKRSIEKRDYCNEPYFFVFHFIKRADKDPRKLSDLDIVCRHHELRSIIEKQAKALAEVLSNSSYMCQRIRGIDSASNEIGCPPEVFATAFRFLRNYKVPQHSSGSFLLRMPVPHISATYHAGEDFFDIAGALRTIDESINFLEMVRGDRIGHALGLGVEPEAHYALKGNRIFLRKQDRLDDIVWLLYRGREIGVHIDSTLYGSLKKEAELLLLEIYGEAIQQNHWHITLTEYYCSMQLRGDDPVLYATMRFIPPAQLGEQYNNYRFSMRDINIPKYREIDYLAGMYYYYNFGKREKIAGSETCEVSIDVAYIRLMRDAQDALQKELESKGIIIECNPSSNVLIGTFGKYQSHPIFRFYNKGLEREERKQLQVCINTDDLGVFDTSQEFEYALLYNSLTDIRDSDGKKRYREDDILQYLDDIRQSGLRAVFASCKG